ncbi:hypothetical protein MNEG_4518 [Monoraphidium neglectum]|uniref:Acyltransferase n=1 Tax=Monoraphidium neglectum TaxID=145388 RepID=A0A0D2JXT3_9CHLO|nr:hypothetical protein MNEG_4518 [Monoraphidium neglectum]KIZ03443.1 hypothetical protein MNEG_4518 [Monoraphidium neglectum]|eukprot:XP_013902462.1 hypothetical protein MNEG_4518 [Monoraphidium neglectum]
MLRRTAGNPVVAGANTQVVAALEKAYAGLGITKADATPPYQSDGVASSGCSDPLASDNNSDPDDQTGPQAGSADAAAPTAAGPPAGRLTAPAPAAAAAAAAACGEGEGDAGGDREPDEDASDLRDQSKRSTVGGKAAAVLKGRITESPSGERVWCDGLTEESRQPWWDETFALVTLAIFTMWIHILAVIVIWGFFNRWALLAAAGIWGTVLLPAEPLLWERFLGNPVFKSWRRYFRYSVAYDVPIDLSKNYVYAEMPHSVFPLSQIIATSLGADAWQGHKVYSIAADSVLSIPLWRHVFTWIGARPANHREFRRLLKRGSVGLVPGGIAEMFLSEAPKADVIKLLDRKGFVRVAVEAGAPLVAIYVSSAVTGRVPLFMCVGKPIPVPKLSPSDPGFKDAVSSPRLYDAACDAAASDGPHARAKRGSGSGQWALGSLPAAVISAWQLPTIASRVDEAHAKLVEETRRIFDKYKAMYPGYANRTLKIV